MDSGNKVSKTPKRSIWQEDFDPFDNEDEPERKRIQHTQEQYNMHYRHTRYTRRGRKHTRHTRRAKSYTKRSADHVLLGKRVAEKLITMAKDSASKYLAYSENNADAGRPGYKRALIPSAGGTMSAYTSYGLELVSYQCPRLNSSGVNNDSVQQRSGDVIHVTGIHGKCRWYIPASAASNANLILDLYYIKNAEAAVANGIKATYTGTPPGNLVVTGYDAGAVAITTSMYGMANPTMEQEYDYLNGNVPAANGIRLLKRWHKSCTPIISSDFYDVIFPISLKFKNPLRFDFSNTAYQEADVGMLWLVARSDEAGTNLHFEMKVYFGDQS